jgi:hypothetical protein
MNYKCTVKTGSTINKDGEFCYTECGLDAKYKCEGWYLCEGHKKYLADIEKWHTEPIKDE